MVMIAIGSHAMFLYGFLDIKRFLIGDVLI